MDFCAAARYRIVIQRLLSGDWSERLAGMKITTEELEADAPRTVLEGRVHDQCEFNGVLGTLCGLRLPLISVAMLGDETPPRGSK